MRLPGGRTDQCRPARTGREGYGLVRSLREILLKQPLIMGHLITHDVDKHDREWFAACKLNQIHSFPGLIYEILRAFLLVWASGIAAAWFVGAQAAATGALLGAQWVFFRARRDGVAAQRLVRWWRWYMLARGLVLAGLSGIAVFIVPEPRVVPTLIAILLLLAAETFAQLTLPVAALASQAMGIAAVAAALLMRSGGYAGTLIGLAVLYIYSAHLRIFNLYYMFATRRLRTRKLKSANETIQLLLNQYDEHGSDCLVETDVQGRIRNASERLCRMAGRPADAINGLKLTALYERGPAREEIRRIAYQLKPFRDLIAPVSTPEGQRWWLQSGCPVVDSSGRLTGFRGFIRDVTDRHRAESRIRFLANHDPLTRIANRAEFQARLDAALEQAPNGLPGAAAIAFAVMFIDLDRFKVINDTFGHAAGDQVLIETALRLTEGARAGDLVARLGGDEFAVLVIAPASLDAVVARGERLIAALSAPIRLEMRSVEIGASVGIALAGQHGATGDELLRAADLALYDAKSNGRGRVAVYSPALLRGLADRQAMEVELRLALARGEFVLYYQPLRELASGWIVGFEALLRWNHPQRGLIDPGKFIPLAEESGLIVPIGEWVLREALAEAATWPADLTVAVNVSAIQLRRGEILRQVVAALSFSGFDPARLELEITETMLIENEAQCLRVLHRLRSLGVRIALDDFGTGYSSLKYLRSFPFDKIKIDRCFVADLSDTAADPGDSAAIVEAVLDLAGKLNMQTIAEGVEDESQLEYLREQGCDQVQGYLTGRAMPAADLPITRIARKHAGNPTGMSPCSQSSQVCTRRLVAGGASVVASVVDCEKCGDAE